MGCSIKRKGDNKLKNTMRKNLFIMFFLGIMILAFSACSSGNDDVKTGKEANNKNNEEVNTEKDNNKEANTENDGETTLSGDVEFMTISLSPAFDEYLDDLKNAFEDLHPDVSVSINDVPFDQVEQYVLTQAASNTLPDVMNLNTSYVKKLAANGALVNMDEAAADVKDTFFEGLWNTGAVHGTVYALPWYTSTGGIIYNPDILEAAGFDAPPSTYEEAWEMSEVIFEKTGAFGAMIGQEMHNLLPKNGIPLLNDDVTEVTFNTPEAVELFRSYKEYYDKGLFTVEVMLGQVSMPELYVQEKIAWWETGPQLFRQVKDLSPEIYEKSIGGPPIDGKAGVQHANPMNIAVAESSKNKDAAVEFAKFVTNAENQLEFGKLASVLPPVIEAANDEFFSQGEDSDDPTERATYFAAQALADAINFTPPAENISEIQEAIQEAFEKVLLEDMDPAEALNEAEEVAKGLLD